MDKFVIINSVGHYGVEVGRSGFSSNGAKGLIWTPEINKATIFSNRLLKEVEESAKKDIVVKISAEETRIVKLIGEIE